jgi:ATP-dependent HslUV protease subunit HslV
MRHADSIHGTTILAVRHLGRVALAGDGQVTHGQTIVKHRARKVQRLHNGEVLAGFAGSTADALALIHRFEARLEEFRGNLQRAAVELAKEWRTDRSLRRLEAFLVVADREGTFLLSGAGDVIAPDDGIVAVGSGGPMALAAARALARHAAGLDATSIAREALRIASEICVYTNDQVEVETLEG